MALALELLPYTRHMEALPVLIDRRTYKAVAPDGRRVPLDWKPYQCLDILTRDMGAMVTRQAMADALWPGEYRVVDEVDAAKKIVDRLRAVLVSIGWTREVVVTRNGVGWQIDTDEVERVIREARGE